MADTACPFLPTLNTRISGDYSRPHCPEHGRSSADPATLFTEHGSVIGTPAYMAPEQAAGQVEMIDTRTDVFGLGAVLCALVSGRPPSVGPTSESARAMAARGDTEMAFHRLDPCRAEADVVALCKRCLSADRAARPATATEVAGAVAELRRAAADRVQQAEQDKLAAEVREG